MILQRLAEHYQRIVSEGAVEIAPPGFSMQKVSFCVTLEPDGTLVQFEDLRHVEGKRLRPHSIIVPGQSKPPGQGINPCLLWDNAEYMLGYTASPERKDRAARAFAAFRDAHLALEHEVDHPSFSAVCRFLQGWEPSRAEAHPELLELATNFGVFRLGGEQGFVHQIVALPSAVNAKAGEDELRTCLISGIPDRIARLHEPKIKGVANAQTSGALLVSFNATAFTSFGRDQSLNAPVGELAVFQYANALNHLLSLPGRRTRLGDATLVYWADGSQQSVEDLLTTLLAGGATVEREDTDTVQEDPEGAASTPAPEDRRRVEEARLLLDHVRNGTEHVDPAPDGEPTRFFILGLSPNASRLSVRLWVDTEAKEMLARLAQHMRDFELAGGRPGPPLSLSRIAFAAGRAEFDKAGRLKGYDTKAVSPQLIGDLARSVLTGTAYPESLLSTMVRRIRADGAITHPRVSAIKACLTRNSRHRRAPKEIPVAFDPTHKNLGYRCGRLFALLEKGQSDALGGELNSTIKDRYFATASATPALVFPRLFRLNNHHLNKLDLRTKIFYERMMATVMAAPFQFPRHLSLADQGEFVIGYFQQRLDLYTPKDKSFQETQ